MTGKKVRVGVYGASGYAGQDLVELLAKHPEVDLVFATANTEVGKPVPGTFLYYIKSDDAPLADVDAVFLALPHGVSAQMAAKALALGVRVLDLSADLRLDTPERYQQWYGHEHPNPELLPTPYGLPEIHRDKLRGIQRVAIPGCYPTTTLLGLYPLLKADALAPNVPIIVDAKSGVSGAGRTAKIENLFVEIYGNLSPYSAGRKHRHVGEIEQEIARHGEFGPLIFVPHLLPVDRGLMASIYVTLNYRFTSDRVRALYHDTYEGEQLVNLLPLDEHATLKHVIRQNHCTISITPVTDQYLHITSVTDNLRKGASGQAVQCFNLMFDFPETMALL
ncbi:MAG: N-acetyl-gamma-glutamyl-phosphate reductase [Phototrophicaceae bacterium]|jgi:N-acetyl-gamma-glutamyl-phosphate reductase